MLKRQPQLEVLFKKETVLTLEKFLAMLNAESASAGDPFRTMLEMTAKKHFEKFLKKVSRRLQFVHFHNLTGMISICVFSRIG